MKIEDVLKLVSKGEGQNIEFKRALTKDISHEVVAMANSGGGSILVGVSDNGEIIGCKLDLDKLSSYLQQITPPIKIDLESVVLNNRRVYVLKVYDDGKLHSIGGIVYIRIGTIKRPLDLQEIGIRLVDTLETYFDKQVSPLKYDEVDPKTLEYYFDRLARIRSREIDEGSWAKYLRSIGAVVEKDGELYLSYAGLLFFYSNPEEYIPYSGLRIVKMGGDGLPVSSRDIYGPIWRIADEAIHYLESEITELEIVIGARRGRIRKYPIRAIREAVINALTHRNYAIASDIILFIYSDRLIVNSPGSLVPGVDLEDPVHIPRNPVLSQLMFDAGYIERYGVGIILMKRLCSEHPYVDVEFKSKGYSFKVIFKLSIEKLGLDDIDEKIMSILSNRSSTSTELAKEVGLSKQATIKRLNKLIVAGLIRRYGKGWRTTYSII